MEARAAVGQTLSFSVGADCGSDTHDPVTTTYCFHFGRLGGVAELRHSCSSGERLGSLHLWSMLEGNSP